MTRCDLCLLENHEKQKADKCGSQRALGKSHVVIVVIERQSVELEDAVEAVGVIL
jgi:hypothetical protein